MSARPLEGRLRRLAFILLRAAGLPFVLRHTLQRRRLTILLFHQQTPECFERTLRVLTRRYHVVDFGTALDALQSGSLRSLPTRPMVITFDDGRASNADLIPLFRTFGIRPTVFVVTGVVGTRRRFWWTPLSRAEAAELQSLPDDDRLERLRTAGLDPLREHDRGDALSAEQLHALAEVADVEPHTRTHPVLTRCDSRRAREEIAGSAEDVRTVLGVQPRVFAYPNGAFSEMIVSIVSETGIRFAVTTEPVLNDARTDPLRLGRIYIRDAAGPSELVTVASGLPAMLKRSRHARV